MEPSRSAKPGLRTSRRRSAGLTLIEILVVIIIITILLAGIMVFAKRATDTARDQRCLALVMMLDQACQAYHADFNEFPPSGGSSNLHQCLGAPVQVVLQHSETGDIITTKPPYVDFRLDMLPEGASKTTPEPPQPIIDAWQREIQYANPGTHNTRGVDIWSKGKDEADEADDLTNWKNP